MPHMIRPIGSFKYELYDYNWSEDTPAYATNSYSDMIDSIRNISEGCVYVNGFKKWEILDGKIVGGIPEEPYEPEFYFNP